MRSQNEARARVADLVVKYDRLSDADRQHVTEAGVIHQFLDPFFDALGWPVQDPMRYRYELNTQAGRPDMTLIPERGGLVFVEAKRFGLIEELQESRKTISGIVTPGQLSLPGMASDRTREEQQAINYAFENGGTWAVLTNFEKLRLFNARRDWLVLSFELPSVYLDEFDLLWQLSYDSVCAGELDRLSNQRHREDVDSTYLEFINEWRERLAQDIIGHPEDNPWAFSPDGELNLSALRAVVQRVLDRLVVVRFAEDHLVVPASTLYSLYELCRTNPYTFGLSEFFAQLFRRFDQLHNSALFAPDLADEAVFTDATLSGLVEKLYEARYRAMSADIMGNTYEQYLGKTLTRTDGQVVTVDNLETRKKQGSYYTPQVIVRHLVDNSLGRYLYGTDNGQADGAPLKGEMRKTSTQIRDLRVLDPACGSGSFLIYAYQVLADFYRSEIQRLDRDREARRQELVREGVTRPFDLELQLTEWTVEIDRLQAYPRIILERHLYGVDLDPQAAEIATVNLIMRAMADQPRGQRRLPLILNQNVKVGNSLIGAGPDDVRYSQHAADLAELRRLRLALADGQDDDRTQILGAIEAIETHVNADLNAALTDCIADVYVHRPFHWAVEFPEVFVDEEGHPLGPDAGFDVVVGNPPWEIVKPDLREFYAQFDHRIESKLTRRQAEARIDELNRQDPRREADWEAQRARIEEAAAYYRQAPDYVRQGRGDTATHKLFMERGYSLLAPQGRLAFVIPSGIYTDLGTKDLRVMLLDEGSIEHLFSFSNERFFFPAVHHSFKFALLGVQRGSQRDGFWATFRFNPRVAVAPHELPEFLADPDNLIYMKRESIARFNPRSLSIMEFLTRRDYEVSDTIYGDFPLLGESRASSPWSLKLAYEFHMTNDRHLFSTEGRGLPLYEGKMIHQYDAFYGNPRYWVEREAGDAAYRSKREGRSEYLHPRLAVRTIARKTDRRSLICAIIPGNTFCGHSLYTDVGQSLSHAVRLFLLSAMNSFVLDYIMRHKVATNVSLFQVYQTPVPRLIRGNPYFDGISGRSARLTCIAPEFAEVWEEALGEPWDQYKGATDQAERRRLRSELDALIAHLYGLSRADFAHILDTFPLVFPDSKAGEAEKEALLSLYDRFAQVTEGWPRD